MKPFKTNSNPILKNVVGSWYGEITLKILFKKPHKVHKNKSPIQEFEIIMNNYVHMECKKFKKQKKKSFQKDF